MSEKGFRFALDDFVYSKDWDPLIEFAEIIKFDLTTTSFKENKTLIQAFKNKNIQFLAEKVETYKEYEAYKNVGCTLFQGYFFCKPEYIKGTSLSAHKLSRIRLLSLINQPEISFTQLEKIIEQDPNLTYLLLKYLNSAQFAFSNSIKSIRQAIVILGIDNIKKWSTLVTLRNILSKPTELLRLSLVRARQAELLAIDNKQSDAIKRPYSPSTVNSRR